jgi:hypothetical protein
VNGRWNDGRVTAVWGLSDGKVMAIRESENHRNKYGTHVTRGDMGERDSMDAINVTGKMSEEGLTLKRGSIMSKKQEEEGYNRSKPSSKEGGSENGGDNKCGMAKKGQGKGKAIAGGKKSMKGCSVFEKPKTGNSTPSKGNLSFNNSKVDAINENMCLRKGKNIEGQESENNSHVGMEVMASTPCSMGSYAQTESAEPVPNNPILKTEEERTKSGKVGTKWKRSARGRPSSSTQIFDREKGNKKREAISDDGNEHQGKRGRITNHEYDLVLDDEPDGSGMAVAGWQPRRPQ